MRTLATKQTAINQYNGFGNQLWDIAGTRPSLDLQFADRKDLVDATTGSNLIDFTRASSGTYVGSDGLIKTATTNLLTYSEEFDQNPPWSAIRASVTSNAEYAPDGTFTADKLIANTDNNTHSVEQTITVIAGATYVFSVYAKAGELADLRILEDEEDNTYISVDLSSGTATGGTITDAGGGWYRCSVQMSVAGTTINPMLRLGNGSSQSFAGNDSDGVYIWGAQLEQSTTVGEYVKTTSTINSAPRFDHDPTTGESLGLLVEESRTNSIRNNTMVGAVAGTPGTLPTNWSISGAGIGTLTQQIVGTGTIGGIAYIDVKFNGTTSTANFSIAQESVDEIIAANGESWTGSVWLSVVGGSTSNISSINLNIAERTSGGGFVDQQDGSNLISSLSSVFTRYTASYTLAGGGTVARIQPRLVNIDFPIGVAIDITLRIGLPQLEQGAFATSVIPTEGSTVTRAADVASISGSNFSSWYRQDEGTILYDQTIFSYPSVGVVSFYAFSDGTSDNRISGFIPAGANHRLRIDESGSNTYLANAVLTADVLSPARVALAFKTNDANCAHNGTLRFLDQSVTIPLVDRLSFGEFNQNVYLSTRIKRFTFWPQRLPDSTLANITT